MNDKEFMALVCYLVLMGSLDNKSPEYICGKYRLLDEGFDAFGALDIVNQGYVLEYYQKWHISLPKEIKEFIVNSGSVMFYDVLERLKTKV